MKSKEKVKKGTKLKLNLKNIIFACFFTIIVFDIVIFYNLYIKGNISYAVSSNLNENTKEDEGVQYSEASKIDIDTVISQNSNQSTSEELRHEDVTLEYLTEYVQSDDLYKGETAVVEDGKKGTQRITYKKIFENGEFKKEEQISVAVVKPALNKVIKVGTKERPKVVQSTQSSTFDMQLNKPSGLSLEQFQKILKDSKDVNKIFEQNADYFYYVEKQYNINGVFVAAIGIHESNWGTSKIAKDKKNLFGYGAYDSNPYNGAYKFSNYSESIDLISRVLVKYYLNPRGTSIYGNEKAVGTYYSSPTLSGVNQKYASDKNWANAVYKHMQYLYGKL